MIRSWNALTAETRQLLVWGTLWGIVVTTAEFAVDSSPPSSFWQYWRWFVCWLTPGWCAVGCITLLLSRRALRHGGRWRLVVVWLAVSLTWGVLAPIASKWTISAMGGQRPGTLGEIITYNLWPALFFGALLVIAYALVVETERTRLLLQDAAIARNRTQALRGEAELSALQRRVDSSLLLNVMADVENRYRDQPEQADELMARFVEFLRCAMPGLSSRASTLRAELDLARAFLRLQAARQRETGDGGATSWKIEESGELPNLPFPSQLLLPLLSLASARSQPCLRLRQDATGVQIEVLDLGQSVPTEFASRVRYGLKSLFGEGFTMSVGSGYGPQLALTLRLPPPRGHGHDR